MSFVAAVSWQEPTMSFIAAVDWPGANYGLRCCSALATNLAFHLCQQIALGVTLETTTSCKPNQQS